MKPARPTLLASGFTLVEVAMVLAIVALLLAGLVPAISSQLEQQRLRETRKQLEEIQQALIGFAIANGRLPCPATSTSNGEESPVGGGNCTNFWDGYVPAATLGIASVDSSTRLAVDSWNNPIRYAVTSWSTTYTTSNGIATAGMSALAPDLRICSSATGVSASDCASASTRLTANSGVPVVLYSTGKNGGYGGTGLDESANPNANSTNNDRVFVSHAPAPASAANGEFDDIVTWISNPLLLNRMVAAGSLP